MLVEVQPAVAAAEEQQRVEARVEARLHHPPDEDVVIAPVIDGKTLAFEYAERFLEDRCTGFAARPSGGAEAVLVACREADRGRLLAGLQNVYREMRCRGERRSASRPLGDADQQERRIERDRGEAIDGEPCGNAVAEAATVLTNQS